MVDKIDDGKMIGGTIAASPETYMGVAVVDIRLVTFGVATFSFSLAVGLTTDSRSDDVDADKRRRPAESDGMAEGGDLAAARRPATDEPDGMRVAIGVRDPRGFITSGPMLPSKVFRCLLMALLDVDELLEGLEALWRTLFANVVAATLEPLADEVVFDNLVALLASERTEGGREEVTGVAKIDECRRGASLPVVGVVVATARAASFRLI